MDISVVNCLDNDNYIKEVNSYLDKFLECEIDEFIIENLSINEFLKYFKIRKGFLYFINKYEFTTRLIYKRHQYDVYGNDKKNFIKVSKR